MQQKAHNIVMMVRKSTEKAEMKAQMNSNNIRVSSFGLNNQTEDGKFKETGLFNIPRRSQNLNREMSDIESMLSKKSNYYKQNSKPVLLDDESIHEGGSSDISKVQEDFKSVSSDVESKSQESESQENESQESKSQKIRSQVSGSQESESKSLIVGNKDMSVYEEVKDDDNSQSLDDSLQSKLIILLSQLT